MSKKEVVQKFIDSGKKGVTNQTFNNEFWVMNWYDVNLIVKKIPKDFEDSLVHDLYYYYLMLTTGRPTPPTTDHHYKLLLSAAANAKKTLEKYNKDCWQLHFLFSSNTSQEAYARKNALLDSIGKSVNIPGLLARKKKLQAEWAQDNYLLTEISTLLLHVPFIKLDCYKYSTGFSMERPFLSLLFIVLLSNNEPAKASVLQWFEEGVNKIKDIPHYKTKEEVIRDMVWVMFRFVEAANDEKISSFLLNRYSKEWCTVLL